jgi:hypothetical protein
MKEWGFVKGSHLELLPGSIPWHDPELAEVISQKFWESKTDAQIWKEMHAQGYTKISYRQIGVKSLIADNVRFAPFEGDMGCCANLN